MLNQQTIRPYHVPYIRKVPGSGQITDPYHWLCTVQNLCNLLAEVRYNEACHLSWPNVIERSCQNNMHPVSMGINLP